jgi:aminoglycoside 3-N-acetyltransferase
MHSRDELASHFRALGVHAGDVVLLHASVRSVGRVAGGPDQIHLALRDALGSAGTLLMYASSADNNDDVGRGALTPAEEAELLAKMPPFDPATTRSARDNGALVEMFRTWPGTRYNDHVTRFVAAGGQAERLLARTPWKYSFGRDSALDRFLELDGRILHLGSDHDTTTFLHYVEHVADFPGKRVARFRTPLLENGARVWRETEEFDSSSQGVHPNWPDRMFARLVDTHLRRTGNTGGRVGDAPAHLFSARALYDFAVPVMQRIAADASAVGELLDR